MFNEWLSALEQAVPLQTLLGYVNFSEGRADPRFQKQLNDAFAFLAQNGSDKPWHDLHLVLAAALEKFHNSGTAAFREVEQADGALRLVFAHVLPAYREHHKDLLFHLSDADLWQPFFLARVFEAVLAQRGPWTQTERIVQGTLKQLNDYVGHRPIAVLESRPQAEPYDHERVRPIPLFLRGAGTAHGRYQALINLALPILRETDPGILADACFDPDVLEELALDPRGYDFHHPAEKRPNYCFGEWDPHHLDQQGRYCRFVLRGMTLEALWQRVAESPLAPGPSPQRGEGKTQTPRTSDASPSGASPQKAEERVPSREEMLLEAAALLAGTILMAAGVSGAAPGTHDSSTSLSTLVPRIARYRDAFYQQLMRKIHGSHAARLRREAELTQQPFGGARQHLNRCLAAARALQMQRRQVAGFFAQIGMVEAARRQVAKIPVASARMLIDLHTRLTSGNSLIDRGALGEAAALVSQIEDLLQRGIDCGALVDPWNILGFQAQFPRFLALEDSVRDFRIDELIEVMDRLFQFYFRLLSESAAHGVALGKDLAHNMQRLADWWDRFATVEVSDVAHVHGGEAAAAATHVAQALGHWHQRGEATADLAFWRQHLDGFKSPKAFALVIDALLNKSDFRAAMALLMTWLGQADQVPLEDGEHAFHPLALRWMLGLGAVVKKSAESGAQSTERGEDKASTEAHKARRAEAIKFFEYLEANAEDYWNVPRLDLLGTGAEQGEHDQAQAEEDDDNLFGAAYEGVTFKDSADDEVEGEVLDFMPQKDFDLTAEADRLERRLHFLATLARLWNIATRLLRCPPGQEDAAAREALQAWRVRAQQNYIELLQLLDVIHEHEVPRPPGSYEALAEYDRRRLLKERLLEVLIATCLDHALAVGALRAALGEKGSDQAGPPWEPAVVQLERALVEQDAARARELLPGFVKTFAQEPLLYVPLGHGGHPRHILRARIAQTILRGLVANLPRQGLVRETFALLRVSQNMEKTQPLTGPRMTEWDRLFHIGCQAMVDAAVDASQMPAAPHPVLAPERSGQGEGVGLVNVSAERLVEALEALTEPFLAVWMEHSRTLRVAVLEGISGDNDWHALREFIQRYGRDLFHPRFLALANIRAVLHRGLGAFLDDLQKESDPLRPIRLAEELQSSPAPPGKGKAEGITRTKAELYLQVILQSLMENYDHYRDYAATTTQSDYGENLHQLLDFLRLKASYDRHAWQLKPLSGVHEILARRHPAAATLWRDQVAQLTRELADLHLQELERLERTHGMRLATLRARLEERFVKPLERDSLCAQVEPAIQAARMQADAPAALALEQALAPLIDTPSGVGLDVPVWLQRLYQEVQRLQAADSPLASLAETLFQVPKKAVSLDELVAQLQGWSQK